MLPGCPEARPCQIHRSLAGQMPALTGWARARPLLRDLRQPYANMMREDFALFDSQMPSAFSAVSLMASRHKELADRMPVQLVMHRGFEFRGLHLPSHM